ncbi:MAG: anion transporter [bacterium]
MVPEIIPEIIAFIVFIMTYAAIALGYIPGLALDRTGIALIGAIAMVTFGVLSTEEAFRAIDASTILLLYALMVISAQLRLGGFYTKVAFGITHFLKKPKLFLLLVMLTSALLSAVLANDVVCLAFTPILCFSLIKASLNPVPFLIGLACASNIGSAATIIGNPQNMLIGQTAQLDFGKFFLWCGPPSLAALVASYLIIILVYRGKWPVEGLVLTERRKEWPDYNGHQSWKGIILIVLLIGLFFTPIPRELSAITVAGLLLCSRRTATRSILGLVDWHLIMLFCGLFIVIAGLVKYGIPQNFVSVLASSGMNINNGFTLSFIAVALSNIVSNVPAVMLLLANIDMGMTTNLYILALASTFAGNLFIIGSIANLITIEQARAYNIHIGFREHARVGIPVTVVSLALTMVWTILER